MALPLNSYKLLENLPIAETGYNRRTIRTSEIPGWNALPADSEIVWLNPGNSSDIRAEKDLEMTVGRAKF
jgi:hypothetical protein